jgi:GNAT superfamily N-acetyltransferase
VEDKEPRGIYSASGLYVALFFTSPPPTPLSPQIAEKPGPPCRRRRLPTSVPLPTTSFFFSLGNITPLLHHYYHRLISSTLYPNRAADPAELDLEDRLAPFVAGFWSSAHRSDCWHLNHLSVAPEHQRQGYGRALVKWGLERAAADSVAASVICAAGKDRFYRRCGFEVEVGRATDGVGNPLRGRVDGGVVLFKDVLSRVRRGE